MIRLLYCSRDLKSRFRRMRKINQIQKSISSSDREREIHYNKIEEKKTLEKLKTFGYWNIRANNLI